MRGWLRAGGMCRELARVRHTRRIVSLDPERRGRPGRQRPGDAVEAMMLAVRAWVSRFGRDELGAWERAVWLTAGCCTVTRRSRPSSSRSSWSCASTTSSPSSCARRRRVTRRDNRPWVLACARRRLTPADGAAIPVTTSNASTIAPPDLLRSFRTPPSGPHRTRRERAHFDQRAAPPRARLASAAGSVVRRRARSTCPRRTSRGCRSPRTEFDAGVGGGSDRRKLGLGKQQPSRRSSTSCCQRQGGRRRSSGRKAGRRERSHLPQHDGQAPLRQRQWEADADRAGQPRADGEHSTRCCRASRPQRRPTRAGTSSSAAARTSPMWSGQERRPGSPRLATARRRLRVVGNRRRQASASRRAGPNEKGGRLSITGMSMPLHLLPTLCSS